MPEIVGTFSSTEAWQERANSSSETGNRSFGGSAQKCLEFAEGHLDGIEVGRVLRQVTKCSGRGQACLALGSSAGAPGPHRRHAVPPPADSFFLKVISCRSKNREIALLLVRIRRLRSAAMVSSKVKSDCSATRANICCACRSN